MARARKPLPKCIDCGAETGHPSRLERCYRCSVERVLIVQAAGLLVHKAIKAGELVRLPCERCGHPRSHAHHHDYSKPLDVTWLCDWHHRREHVEIRKQLSTGGQ